VLVEDGPATVLVYPERACLVVPALTNIPPTSGPANTSCIACPPTAEASVLIHVCNAMLAIYVDGADIVIFHPASECTEVVVARPEGSSATTKVCMLVEDSPAFTAAVVFTTGFADWTPAFGCFLSLESVERAPAVWLAVVGTRAVVAIMIIEATRIAVECQEAVGMVIAVWLVIPRTAEPPRRSIASPPSSLTSIT